MEWKEALLIFLRIESIHSRFSGLRKIGMTNQGQHTLPQGSFRWPRLIKDKKIIRERDGDISLSLKIGARKMCRLSKLSRFPSAF